MTNGREADTLFVNSISDTAVNNGIIAQHTLYPYHFMTGSAQLNDLGVRELAVLSDHFKTATGQLNVRKGDTGNELYQARLKTVTSALAAAGVKGENVVVKDGAAGGSGMSSERLNAGLKSMDSDKSPAGSNTSMRTSDSTSSTSTEQQ